jgi:hypothetical protein
MVWCEAVTSVMVVIIVVMAGVTLDHVVIANTYKTAFDQCEENLMYVSNISNQNADACTHNMNMLEDTINKLNDDLNDKIEIINSKEYCPKANVLGSDTTEFQSISKEVYNQYTYNETFRCLEFSEELTKRLNENGYTSRIVYGNYNQSGYHAWVEVIVPVEATGGYVIPMWDYIINYEPLEYKGWS